jgi:hypothetical protein
VLIQVKLAEEAVEEAPVA